MTDVWDNICVSSVFIIFAILCLWLYASDEINKNVELRNRIKYYVTQFTYFLVYLGGAGLIFYVTWESISKAPITVLGLLLVTFSVAKMMEGKYTSGFSTIPKEVEGEEGV